MKMHVVTVYAINYFMPLFAKLVFLILTMAKPEGLRPKDTDLT